MSTTVTSTATFGMDAFASLAVVPSANDTRGTITFTSAAPKSDRPSFTAKLQAKEFGPFLVPMSVSIVVEDGSCTYQLTGNSGGYSYDTSNNVTGLVGPDGSEISLGQVHRNLWTQFSATTMCADDGTVLDLSGNANHAARGANLSIAQMNGVAGYYSTLLAGTNGHDPSLHMPSINFDYNGGEILLLVTLFNMATPAADGAIIANSSSTSANGFRIRARTTGYLDVGMFSTTGAISFASGNCINVLLDSTLHQFAVLINGRTQQGIFWEDGAVTRATVTFPATCDTRESVSLNMGSVLATPTVIAHTSATQQRGTVIMRWGANDPAPDTADITALLAKLRRDPGRVVVMGDV